MTKIYKRDGRIEYFNPEKIVTAIRSAARSLNKDNEQVKQLATSIAAHIAGSKKQALHVEAIQDIIEKKLMASCHKDIAKAFLLYRSERTRIRDSSSLLVKRVNDRLEMHNIENSNANVDEKSFSGREKEASSDVQKFMAIDLGGLSEKTAQAHKDMLVYQHDLDKALLGMHNCLQIDFAHVFKHGFTTRNGDVRPPNSFSAACQLVAVIFQCQSQVQFGGVGSIHLDYDLAPFVRKSFVKHFSDGVKYIEEYPSKGILYHIDPNTTAVDDEIFSTFFPKAYSYAMDMLEREGKQSAQALYHNLNTLESRQGSQVPFTSINIGRDTSPEGRMVTRWLLEASIEGIGKHHLTSIFPISIFQYKEGCNAKPEDPNYDLKQLALKSMSRRIYPNWCNGNWSGANEDASDIDTLFSTMGCRTLIGFDRHGLGYKRTGRGNNTPATIILPKLGIQYGICLGKRKEPDLAGFWKAFEDALLVAEHSLVERFNIMAKQRPQSAPFMYQNGTIQDAQKCTVNVFNALRHNTLAIGYIGVAELCQALYGANHVHDAAIHAFALKVVHRINQFAAEASERNNLNFSCYATPAEGLCHTALKALRQQYGVIPNVTDHEYLTNSHHVPVWEEVSILQKLEVEAPFCKYPTGGCITYVELNSTFVNNTQAIESIIDHAFTKLDIPYLAFNFPIDSCLDCGYQAELNNCCPECGSKNIQQLRRVTGYLTMDYRNFNDGKQQEVIERVKHSPDSLAG